MPQPVDLQTELMRLNAAERVRQVADRASLAAQQRASAHEQEEQVRAETQVKETVQPERQALEGQAGDPKRRKRPKHGPHASDDLASRTLYDHDEKPRVVDDPEDHQLDISV